MTNILKIRKDFPILSRKVNDKPLVYLDNAATSQKPFQVIDAIANFYKNHNANVHRGIHTLSIEATEMLEAARVKVAKFIGANDPSEIVFVRNATEGINLVARSLGDWVIRDGDEIVLTQMEHHSNIVAWQQLAERVSKATRLTTNAIKIKYIPIDSEAKLDLSQLDKLITKKTKVVSLCHVSNVLGTINPVLKIIKTIRYTLNANPLILIDGAQAVPHMPVDVSKLGCDFYVFSAHKMLGPTGIGVLWAKKELLDAMPAFLVGGEMIKTVDFDKSTWNDVPLKFEAGTPNVAGAIGLAAAIDYLNKLGIENIQKHEKELTRYALCKLSKIDDIKIFGPKNIEDRNGVISFNIGDVHAHDVASILDSDGIAIRSGHHCAQPLMEVLGIPAVARASFYLYNTKEEIDRLIGGIKKVRQVFKLQANRLPSTVYRKDKSVVSGL